MDRDQRSERQSPPSARTQRQKVRVLLHEARRARHARMLVNRGDLARQVERALLVDEALNALQVRSVDLNSYLTRLVSCQQLASSHVMRAHTRIDAVSATRWTAKVLGVALTEVVHFVDRGAANGDGVQLSVALRKVGGFLVTSLVVMGDYRLVAPVEATAALARATRLIEASGGALRRGEEGGRMLIEIVLPWRPIPEARRRSVAAR